MGEPPDQDVLIAMKSILIVICLPLLFVVFFHTRIFAESESELPKAELVSETNKPSAGFYRFIAGLAGWNIENGEKESPEWCHEGNSMQEEASVAVVGGSVEVSAKETYMISRNADNPTGGERPSSPSTKSVVPVKIVRPVISAPYPNSYKKVNGRLICAKKNDHPEKSKKNKKKHMDMECCLDPDEIPNPHCYYPPEKYGKYL